MTDNYKYTVDTILSMEKKLKLHSIKVDNVYFWQLIRIPIFIELLNSYSSTQYSLNKTSLILKQKLFKRVFLNSIILNPLFDIKPSSVLIFGSGHKQKLDNKFIDISTHYLCKDLTKKNIDYTLYETNYKKNTYKNREKNHKHLDFVVLSSRLYSLFFYQKINFTKNDIFSILKTTFESYLKKNIDIDIEKIALKKIAEFKFSLFLYRLLLKNKKPKKICIISSIGKEALIKAAKDLNISVEEYQHGLIVNTSLVANYPSVEKNSLDYFPDYFYLWNKPLTCCSADIPLSSDRIKTFENKHLQYLIRKTRYITKEKKSIMIVSQPYGSDAIQNFIERNIKHLKSYNIFYKIHPAENIDLIADYQKKMIKKYKNIKFIDVKTSPYTFLKKSQYVLGIHSTLLFEATVFDCQILILKVPGYEASNLLVTEKKARLIEKSINIIDVIK